MIPVEGEGIVVLLWRPEVVQLTCSDCNGGEGRAQGVRDCFDYGGLGRDEALARTLKGPGSILRSATIHTEPRDSRLGASGIVERRRSDDERARGALQLPRFATWGEKRVNEWGLESGLPADRI